MFRKKHFFKGEEDEGKEQRELFQLLSLLVQKGNAALFNNRVPDDGDDGIMCTSSQLFVLPHLHLQLTSLFQKNFFNKNIRLSPHLVLWGIYSPDPKAFLFGQV